MDKTEIVETKSGKIQGYMKKGVKKFKGIPFAKPPIGALRFKPPEPLKWDNVLESINWGPECPQPSSNLWPSPLKKDENNCLSLNIWTPALDDGKRPVLFWIHGGGFFTGSGAMYDGSRMAIRGDVVVVTMNYRLGALGFFYYPDEPDISANVGLLDQVLALEWTRDNIESFGGDPNNVTIFGESAGGMAVGTLLAMPKAKGLFHRAIPQSGSVMPLMSKSYGKFNIERSEQLIRELGIDPSDPDYLTKLRKKSSDEILKIQMKMSAEFANSGRIGSFGPVIDGEIIPKAPLEAIREGNAKDIDILIGTNLDEAVLFNALNPDYGKLDENGLSKEIYITLRRFGQDKEASKIFLEKYKKAREGKYSTKPQDIMDAFRTDYSFRIPEKRLLEAQFPHHKNIYSYLFTWEINQKLRASHAVEIPFVFGSLFPQEIGTVAKRTEITEKLSEQMMDSWIAFAKKGNPNHEGIPNWPPYDLEKRSTMLFDEVVKIEDDPLKDQRLAWEKIL